VFVGCGHTLLSFPSGLKLSTCLTSAAVIVLLPDVSDMQDHLLHPSVSLPRVLISERGGDGERGGQMRACDR